MSSDSNRGGTSGQFARWIIIILLAGGMFLLFPNTRNHLQQVQGDESSSNSTGWPAQPVELAGPSLPAQYFGTWQSLSDQDRLEMVGKKLITSPLAAETTLPITFKILAAPQMANAFILPGGQIYITSGLVNRLKSEGELAGVLSHEIAHIISGNTDAQIARNQVTYGLEPEEGGMAGDEITPSQLANLELSRENELEADFLGICILQQAGYDPEEFLRVLHILEEENREQHKLPETLSTHPSHASRMQRLEEIIGDMDQCRQ